MIRWIVWQRGETLQERVPPWLQLFTVYPFAEQGKIACWRLGYSLPAALERGKANRHSSFALVAPKSHCFTGSLTLLLSLPKELSLLPPPAAFPFLAHQRRGTMVRVGKYLLVCCFFPRQTDLPLCPPCGARKNLRAARLLDFFDRCGCSASLHLSRAALGSASHSLRPGNNQDRYFLPLAIPTYNEADRLGSAWAVGAYLDEAAGRLFYFSSRARAYGIWARAGRRRRKIPTGPPLNLPPENFCSIREQIFVLDLHSRQKSCTMKSRLR